MFSSFQMSKMCFYLSLSKNAHFLLCRHFKIAAENATPLTLILGSEFTSLGNNCSQYSQTNCCGLITFLFFFYSYWKLILLSPSTPWLQSLSTLSYPQINFTSIRKVLTSKRWHSKGLKQGTIAHGQDTKEMSR